MINQEMIANPVLEELSKSHHQRQLQRRNFPESRNRESSGKAGAQPFDEFDIAAFFNQYLDTGSRRKSQEHEIIERPSFEKFISSPAGLTEHLGWQLSVTMCSETVREIDENDIGNLDENGYLTASLEEIAKNGKYSLEDWKRRWPWCRNSIRSVSPRATCASAC